jgi:hypothetical protein
MALHNVNAKGKGIHSEECWQSDLLGCFSLEKELRKKLDLCKKSVAANIGKAILPILCVMPP